MALVNTSDVRPPGNRAEGARLRSLASMARALGRSGGLLDVVERAITEGYRVVDADSGSVSVLDRPAGLVRVLVNVGDLSETEAGRPTDETYRLADFPKLDQVVSDLRAWTCAREDPDADQGELALLVELDKGASLGAPVLVDGELWGELYLTRHSGATSRAMTQGTVCCKLSGMRSSAHPASSRAPWPRELEATSSACSSPPGTSWRSIRPYAGSRRQCSISLIATE